MSRQIIINNALKQLGVCKGPLGTEYGRWFDGNWNDPWCAIFVSWIYAISMYPLGHIDSPNGFCSVQNGYDYWRKTGELTYIPTMGDIVLYNLSGGHCDHCGIFYKFEGGQILTIEGNTSNNLFPTSHTNKSGKLERDGGFVMAKSRPIKFVKSFVSPNILKKSGSEDFFSDKYIKQDELTTTILKNNISPFKQRLLPVELKWPNS